MATFVIGDVHGCFDELMRLIKKIAFNPKKDKLIFVGDLINRGPKSLEVLRYVKSLGQSAEVVLGNHDITLIAYSAGILTDSRKNLEQIMQAPDAQELIQWLRQRPLLLEIKKHDCIVVHAAIPPQWSLKKAKKQAIKAQKKLAGKQYIDYLSAAYGNGPDSWHKQCTKAEKFRYAINGFTRLRYCYTDGKQNLTEKSPLGKHPANLISWFNQRETMQFDGDAKVIFGHWASLGYHKTRSAICIDSGCVWDGELTALKLSNKGIKKIQVSRK